MSNVTRRTALGAVSAAALGGFGARAQTSAGPASGGAAPLRVRRNVANLTPDDPDLAALTKAMQIMGGRTDSLSWAHQVDIHAGEWGQHGGWRFLPWHRMQLYWFERIVAKLSGKADFAMPYWDWQTKPVLPGLFTSPSSPFFHQPRRPGLANVDFVQERIRSRFSNWANVHGRSFKIFAGSASYGGAVESSGHAFVHVVVDGDMGQTSTAPRDPLFWFHHCNVDRVWATWQAGAAQRGVVMPQAWLAERCDMFVDETGAPARAMTTADVLKTEPLGYRYDAPYPMPAFDAQPPTPPPGTTRREAVQTRTVQLALTDAPGATGMLRIPLPPDVEAMLASDKTGTAIELQGVGRVRVSGERLAGSAISIGVRQFGGGASGTSLKPMATVIPFAGGHGADAHAGMADMPSAPPASHEHGFVFIVGPQVYDATGMDGVMAVEIEASSAWAAYSLQAPNSPPPPLITALGLDLTITKYKWV